tara:strand:- start:153 stop:458 length:306 start_codon:yes stop_codon:yes gene_type:complete
MENTMLFLEQQHDLLLKQNNVLVDGLNITLEMEEIIINNQNILWTISNNIQYTLLFHFLSIMLIALILIVMVCHLEKITKKFEDVQDVEEVKNGAYVVMAA